MRRLLLIFAAGFAFAVVGLPALAADTPGSTTTALASTSGTTTTSTTGTTTAGTTTTGTTTTGTTTTGTTTTGTTTSMTTTSSTTTTPSPSVTTPGHRSLHWFAGSVTGVGSNSLSVGVLWTGPDDGSLDGQTLTVNVVTPTRISRGPRHVPIALGQVQSGDLVSVRAAGPDLSDLTAASIHVDCDCHWIGGTISSIGSNSINVQVSRTGPYDTVLNGTDVTIQTGPNTVYLRGRHRVRIGFGDLQMNEGVGVVFSANGFFKAPGFDPSTATFTAARVHVWGTRQVPAASSDSDLAASPTQ